MYFCKKSVINKFQEIINLGIENISLNKHPKSLYDPLKYVLGLGGKRIRPVLTLMSCDAFGQDPLKALNAALCVETFHNFTLIHDDIMDSAQIRRNKETVHKKWGINTGILTGDRMLILAYQLLGNYDSKKNKELNEVFSKTAMEICEGQQLDIDFESRFDVTREDYIKMIKLKTAVLIACSLKMGAIVAGTKSQNQDLIYDFGISLGIAFQIQDDYLDVFGDQSKIGKKVGGDILENKKTILFHIAFSQSDQKNKDELTFLYGSKKIVKDKISIVKSIFLESNAKQITKELIENYTADALLNLEKLKINNKKKQALIDFSNSLMKREL